MNCTIMNLRFPAVLGVRQLRHGRGDQGVPHVLQLQAQRGLGAGAICSRAGGAASHQSAHFDGRKGQVRVQACGWVDEAGSLAGSCVGFFGASKGGLGCWSGLSTPVTTTRASVFCSGCLHLMCVLSHVCLFMCVISCVSLFLCFASFRHITLTFPCC